MQRKQRLAIKRKLNSWKNIQPSVKQKMVERVEIWQKDISAVGGIVFAGYGYIRPKPLQ